MSHHGHDHVPTAHADRRWLLAALTLIVAFMIGEVVAGVSAHSLALFADAGHMLTDAAAIGLAVWAARVARLPPRGAFTYGFARVEVLAGQINGATLIVLALWFTVEAVRRLVSPGTVHGGAVATVAVVGAVVSGVATLLVSRANRESLNVRGVFAHLLTDLWAFGATAIAGLIIAFTGWGRADAVASLIVAVVMTVTGARLVLEANRFFMDPAPPGLSPRRLGAELAAQPGVAELHDLHVWEIGGGETALSAHLLVSATYDCHELTARLRDLLVAEHGIGHVTLQADHADPLGAGHDAAHCEDSHGQVHRGQGLERPPHEVRGSRP